MEYLSEIRLSPAGFHTVSITFERESFESDIPPMEAIYKIQTAESSNFAPRRRVLVFQSCTRTDTRQDVEMTPEEEQEIINIASMKVGEAEFNDALPGL